MDMDKPHFTRIVPVDRDRLLELRMETLESKVDILIGSMQRAMGAWTFIKIMAAVMVGVTSMAVSVTLVWAFFETHNPFK